ncbi:MAG: hypothetical protein IH591_07440 [Bacteroidales bacterium]|nr:hypothetical protein [Bacteroidales bacterium]
MNKNQKKIAGPEWFRLDNAAKIYPAVIGGDFTAVFRISVTLQENIIYSALADAIPLVSQRFPYFNVTLSHGLFWYYLEKVGNHPRLHADENEICTAFPIGSKKEVMYRILVRDKTISVEFVHIITDGGGALEFLKTLLFQYLKNCGKIDRLPEGVFDPAGDPEPHEYEDSFSRHFNKRIPPTENPKPALHLPFRFNTRPRFRTLTAEVSSDEIYARAKAFNVSITEYLVAVYLAVLQDIFFELPEHKRRGAIRVQVPVNLRKLFGSRTMRNFSLFVVPEIDLRLGRFSFNDIASTVHHMVRLETHPLRISRIIKRNVGSEKNIFIRIIPVFVKRMILYLAYYTFGSGLCTGVLTNMGKLDLPPEISQFIDSVAITPPPPNNKVKISCGVASIGDRMRITFGSIAEGQRLENAFLRFLLNEGIEVKLLK